ncbi:MAG: aquaporin [Tannerellaceae bacterium]|nr:aquaporin [Tannerellaceae bacterium]
MYKKYLAECIGTMVLVLMGCGCAVMNGGATSVAAVLTIGFAFGLSVVAMAYTIGSISGCHINPAITLGVWLSGKIPGGVAVKYMLAQVIGGILGSLVLYIITRGLDVSGTGANSYVEGYGWVAFVAEMVFTFVFVFVVLGATSATGYNASFTGLAIGLTLVLVHIVCIPITGTSVNPARSIGPALFEGGIALSQLWLFIVAPLLGGALAAGVWKILGVKEMVVEKVVIEED